MSFTYEKITIALNDDITVLVYTMNTAQPGKQIAIEHTFVSGTSGATIDAKIATIAGIVWALQT